MWTSDTSKLMTATWSANEGLLIYTFTKEKKRKSTSNYTIKLCKHIILLPQLFPSSSTHSFLLLHSWFLSDLVVSSLGQGS